jgi:transposase
LVGLLEALASQRTVTVALEPSGTYGDPLRQALEEAGLAMRRVNPKAAHDYAEVFDGVPSQHDGKDAAVVAELAALGKATPWPYHPPSEWEQELAYWVEWMDAQSHLLTTWQGRIEALLSRHWPEATRVLKVASATLLRVLEGYGGPAALAADAAAAARVQGWGAGFWTRRRCSVWWPAPEQRRGSGRARGTGGGCRTTRARRCRRDARCGGRRGVCGS